VCSVGSFYVGQERPVTGGFWQSGVDGLIDDSGLPASRAWRWSAPRCSSWRGSSACAVARSSAPWQPCYERLRDNGAEERPSAAADEPVVILDDWTRLKTAAGKTNFYPSLLHKG